MGLRVIKVVFWGLIAILLGCGSSSKPPTPQVTEFALVANLDASSVSTFNVADTISSWEMFLPARALHHAIWNCTRPMVSFMPRARRPIPWPGFPWTKMRLN